MRTRYFQDFFSFLHVFAFTFANILLQQQSMSHIIHKLIYHLQTTNT